MCKESVNQAYETTLQEGLLFEKRTFHTTFATVRCINFNRLNNSYATFVYLP